MCTITAPTPQLTKFLGKGTFGAVYQAKREADGKTYAIKKVDTRKMSAKERAEAVNEIRVLASVAGDHVITFYEAFVEHDILYIVTEFATSGDLLQLLKSKGSLGLAGTALLFGLLATSFCKSGVASAPAACCAVSHPRARQSLTYRCHRAQLRSSAWWGACAARLRRWRSRFSSSRST